MTTATLQTHATARRAPNRTTAASILQRSCDCGHEADRDDERAGRPSRANVLQRCGWEAIALTETPAMVRRAIAQPGQALDPNVRRPYERAHGRDFSAVRIHVDEAAAAAARAISSFAYTVGNDIAFAAGRFSPTTEAGRRLLGHELAHVAQQAGMPEGDSGPSPTVLSDPSLERQADSSGDPDAREPEAAIRRYSPARRDDPDGRSRSTVWAGLLSPYQKLDASTMSRLGAPRQEAAGIARIHVGGRASAAAEAVDAAAFTVGRDVVFGANQFDPDTGRGLALIAHEIEHVRQQAGAAPPTSPAGLVVGAVNDPLETEAQRQPWGGNTPHRMSRATVQRVPVDPVRAVCETTQNPPPATPGDCWYREPEHCPTYAGWLATFTRLTSFRARTTVTPSNAPTGGTPPVFDVLGGRVPAASAGQLATPARAARYGGAAGGDAPAEIVGRERFGERFVDHPTDQWVQRCLPPNLRATAYQLPSDCADIAVILRHVWLAAHHRTEVLGPPGRFVIGDGAGEAAQARIGRVISDVGTANVDQMVSPYSDSSGARLLAFSDLAPLLRVGDILVWAHYDNRGGYQGGRSGGHTHTISHIERQGGRIVSISVLQGNLPIFGERGSGQDDKGDILAHLGRPDTDPLRKALGVAPGRRIERDALTGGDLSDAQVAVGAQAARPRWQWSPGTILVAAGPPRAAARPARQRDRAGRTLDRRLTDWLPSFARATSATIAGVVEAMVLEARRFLEGGIAIPDADAERVGAAAGARVWQLAKAAGGLGRDTHFIPTWQTESLLAELQREATTAAGRRTLGLIAGQFERNARGAADLGFGGPSATPEVRMLLTGFDPFTYGHIAPEAGTWNPSSSAVLALDGEDVELTAGRGRRPRARVESVVLPVDFRRFSGGIIERLVRPLMTGPRAVDGVITVSMGNTAQGPNTRIERYAVGVHRDPLSSAGTRPVPAAAPEPIGPAIIESNAPVGRVAAEARRVEDSPTVGEDLTFDFFQPAAADDALRALGLAPRNARQVDITNEAAIRQIVRTMRRQPNGIDIRFDVGKRTFTCRVVSGPGGDFLSNEVSYRVLRAIGSRDRPLSFHVHTPAGEPIPETGGTRQGRARRRAALTAGRGLRGRLIDTLKRIISATGRVILERRQSGGGSTP